MKNKYIVELGVSYNGRIVVSAKNKKEAEEISEKILESTYTKPSWFEVAGESAEVKKKVTTKKDKTLIKEELIKEYKV